METNQKKQWVNPEILDLDVLDTKLNNDGDSTDGEGGWANPLS